MKKIFLLTHSTTYDKSKVLLAYENKSEAEEAASIFKGVVRGELEVIELFLQPAKPHTPLPVQPRINLLGPSFGAANALESVDA